MRLTARSLALSVMIALAMLVSTEVYGQDKTPASPGASLSVAFGETQITPPLDAKAGVWLAGYMPGRRASAVHDPLYARCVVLSDQTRTIAMVSVDLIGLQYPVIKKIRAKINEVDHVIVSSTHNHEGPDTIGLWGPSFFRTGVDKTYLDFLTDKIVKLVKEVNKKLSPAAASFGISEDEKLVGDRRLPITKDGRIRTLSFQRVNSQADKDNTLLGLVVQWNCHPETLGSKNKQVTADFVSETVSALKKRYGCPVVYFSGVLGGLMAPPRKVIKGEKGQWLREGQFEFCRRYGQEVANLAGKAVAASRPISLVPFRVAVTPVSVPVANPWYRTARLLRVVKRDVYYWTGDYRKRGDPVVDRNTTKQTAIETEVGCIQFGAMKLFSMPGEIYPELVRGTFQNPVEPNVDFPDAPKEPTVESMVDGDKWMLLGLANDEIGYIIPRCQWDRQRPFAYGRMTGQYGEINSCGPDVAPIVMQAVLDSVNSLKGKR